MQPQHDTKTPARPDCPREYHDDYIGKPAGHSRGFSLGIAALLLAILAVATWAAIHMFNG